MVIIMVPSAGSAASVVLSLKVWNCVRFESRIHSYERRGRQIEKTEAIRVKEHPNGLRRLQRSTPLGEHRVDCHDGAMVLVAVAILARESACPLRER